MDDNRVCIGERRVLAQGERGSNIVLPPYWVRECGLSPGDRLAVSVRNNGGLEMVVSPTAEPSNGAILVTFGVVYDQGKYRYTRVTLPALFRKQMNLKNRDTIQIFRTPDSKDLILRKKEEPCQA